MSFHDIYSQDIYSRALIVQEWIVIYTDDYFRGFRAFVEFCVSVLTEQRSIFSAF